MNGLLHNAKSWLDASLGFFYPDLCQICEKIRATKQEGYVCVNCRAGPGGVRFIQAPFCERCGLPYEGDISQKFECGNCREMRLHFAFARAAVVASPLVLEVIHRYKYKGALWFEPFLVFLLETQAVPALRSSDWDWIVPVPLHPMKEILREFNQSERLAAHLSAAVGIPLKKILRRIEETRTQTLLSRAERATNVKNAFQLRAECRLDGERIVLVDDVLTTGATTSACAKKLVKAGAGQVCVWTVARGLWK
jgi:competence protein ComFC